MSEYHNGNGDAILQVVAKGLKPTRDILCVNARIPFEESTGRKRKGTYALLHSMDSSIMPSPLLRVPSDGQPLMTIQLPSWRFARIRNDIRLEEGDVATKLLELG